MKRFVLAVFLLTLIAAGTILTLDHPSAQASPRGTVGIWYSTWWSNGGHYIWSRGHGAFTHTQILADINDDGKADAVSVDTVNGDWYVATSTGSLFDPESRWIHGFGVGTTAQYLADVNDNRKADAVTFDAATGGWWVALSTGSTFGTPSRWTSGHGAGSTAQFLADVNDDRKADAVTFDAATGHWWVALSTGSTFGTPSRWTSGHGAGSTAQFLVDTNGDAMADAVSVDTGSLSGDWYVSLSTGSTFDTERQWLHGFGIGSRVTMGDVTGDGKADAIAYVDPSQYAAGGSAWYRAAATTTGICSGGQLAPCFSVLQPDDAPWKREHGDSPYHYYSPTPHTPATWISVAEVRGAGIADPVAFHGDSGVWQVLPSYPPGETDPYPTPNMYNRWDAFDVPYLPITHGVPTQYDSSDASVIDEHLEQISDAGIDYLLFDLTNGFETDDIHLKALAVCRRLDAFDRAGHNLRFAVALGNHVDANGNPDPADVEREASELQETFLADPTCGPRYQQWQDRPLLVLLESWNTRIAWEEFTPKTSTLDFTIQWASGRLPECLNGGCPATYPSRDSEGCPGDPPTTNTYPPPSYYGEYVGWGTPWGSVGSGPDMTVMPGWYTIAASAADTNFVSRTQYGLADGFYTQCAWNRVLAASPPPMMVVIVSYNDFIEETAVQPADTGQVVPCQYCSEPWPTPDIFWNDTKRLIAFYRGASPVGGTAEYPDVAQGSPDQPASPTSTGLSASTHALLAAGVVAALVLATGAWYARKRWPPSMPLRTTAAGR